MTLRLASGLGEIAGSYDVAFCDIWGVVHNGHAVFPGAGQALTAFRAGGRVVILVSNAPRPSESIVPQLDRLGLERSAWDAIVTSGDVTRSHIAAAAGKPVLHLGPERDRPLSRVIRSPLRRRPTALSWSAPASMMIPLRHQRITPISSRYFSGAGYR